jgi:hypothetical protein
LTLIKHPVLKKELRINSDLILRFSQAILTHLAMRMRLPEAVAPVTTLSKPSSPSPLHK